MTKNKTNNYDYSEFQTFILGAITGVMLLIVAAFFINVIRDDKVSSAKLEERKLELKIEQIVRDELREFKVR